MSNGSTKKESIAEKKSDETQKTKKGSSPKPGTDKLKENGQELIVRFKVNAKKEEIAKEFDELAGQYVADVKIPGFRKGKTPVDVVKNRYKKDLIDEALNKIIQKKTIEKIKNEKIEAVSPPMVEKMDYKEGGDLEADIYIEKFPQIDLPEFEKVEISVSKDTFKVEGFDEKKQINALLEANMSRAPIGDREIIENDQVMISYQSKDKKTKRMSPRKETVVMIKTDTEYEIPGMGEELKMRRVGETLVVTRKYEKEFPKKVWAGKEMEHHIQIKQAVEYKKPALDEDFLKKIGFKDENSLKEKMKQEYDGYQKKFKDEKKLEVIFDHLNESLQFPIPRSLVEQEMKRMLSGTPQLPQLPDEKKRKEFLDSLTANAEKNVKTSFIMDAVKKKVGFKVASEDYEKEYKRIAEINNIPVKEVKKYYMNSEKKQEIEDGLVRQKVINHLVEKIKVKEV